MKCANKSLFSTTPPSSDKHTQTLYSQSCTPRLVMTIAF